MQSNRPDWVQCPSCHTVYAPSLIGRYGCPRCGELHWYPAAIPNGPEAAHPEATYARLM